jgi:beta-lactamase class A
VVRVSTTNAVAVDLAAAIGDEFAAADVEGFLHAKDLETGAEVSHDADRPVVLASVFKIAVLAELFRQADDGEIDLTEQVTVAVDGRTEGPFGLSVMRDPVTMSWRDLAWSMMSISDNAATDVICERIRIDRVNASLRNAGHSATVLTGSCRSLFDSIREDLGMDPSARLDEVDLRDPEVLARLRATDPTRTSRSTPRETTALLAEIWADRAASPASCAAMRRILREQVWPHRLASGFPEDDVTTSGKTGTLPPWRNEAGVVTLGNGRAIAVAVFTRGRRRLLGDPGADAVIGRAARLAVDALCAIA